jgi:hypothetical protein
MWLNSYYVSLKALIMFIHVLFPVTAVPVVILVKPTFLSFVKYVQYKCVGCRGQICYWKQRFVIYISFMMHLDHLTSCYLLHIDNLYLPEMYVIHYTYQFHAFSLQVLSRHIGTSTHICITVSRNPLSIETIDSAFVYCLVVLRFLFQRILYFNTFEADTNPRFLHFCSFFVNQQTG